LTDRFIEGRRGQIFSPDRAISIFLARALTWHNVADNVNSNKTLVNMLEVIEKLLVLQDRDQRIIRARSELQGIPPQRQGLQSKAAGAQAALEAAKLKVKQIETERKKLELDIDAKKQLIEKYSLQQFQTKKNEEYKALAHEIEMCKDAIFKIEDLELDQMEQAEAAQKRMADAVKAAATAKSEVDRAVAEIGQREENFKKQLAELEANRSQLASAIDPEELARYDRLLKHRGGNIIVGIEHAVCGGCHMKLPTQVLVACQSESELNTCPHCGRILYYTRDMELAVKD
jgi:predicted  nucleic acid-binding Zn-ribbon protein